VNRSFLEEESQLQARLLRLLEYAEGQQRQLEALTFDAQEHRVQLDVLVQALTAARSESADERLAELLSRAEATLEGQAELSQSLTKLTRTQFKANSLSETQTERLAQSLTVLQELLSRREALQEERHEEGERRRRELRAAGRGELAAELLPALDGLEAAVASARSLLRQLEARAAPEPAAEAETAPPAGFWGRFSRRRRAAPPAEPKSPEAGARLAEGLGAWLQGLELVHERFVKLLESEGITPIDPLGEAFDPRAHVAIEAAKSEEPSGTVLQVLRKGYLQRGRVLRYAEVVVARGGDDHNGG
jgi:molecular chaperone GrpE (heat shock protein)